MKNNKNHVKSFSIKRKTMGYEVFLVGYIILIIMPSMVMSTEEFGWLNVALALGLAALVLFSYFDKVYITSVSWGMRSIYTTLDAERYYMNFHRTHFWKEVDVVLSYDIEKFLKDKIRELAVMGKLGSKIRILLLDPESKYVDIIEKSAGMKPGEYAYYVLQIQNFVLRVRQTSMEDTVVDIEIKYYDSFPLDNMFRAHDTMFAYDSKQYSDADFLSYSFENGLNGYNFFRTLFEEKWNDQAFSYEKEITGNMVPNYRAFADNDTISYKV